MEATRIEGVTSKAPQLVLQANAIIGDKASPKVLLQFMKALTTYFDQTPGTFSILRNYLKYVMSEISSGRPSIEVPMERNDYANDLPSPLILSKYLKIQSQAFRFSMSTTQGSFWQPRNFAQSMLNRVRSNSQLPLHVNFWVMF